MREDQELTREVRQSRRRRRPGLEALEGRLCQSTFHIAGASPASIVLQTTAGGAASIQYSFTTTDRDEVSEGEPLVIHSGDGAFADVRLEPTFGQVGTLKTLSFRAKGANETITATIVGGDGDEDANIVTPGEVTPRKVQPQANGDLLVTYSVVSQLPAGTTRTIGVFWASGPKGNEVLPAGKKKPLYTYTVDSSKVPGTYTFTVPAAALTTAPRGAADLLVVADPGSNLGPQEADLAVLADPAHLGALTPAQLAKVMPGLGAAGSATLAAPLNAAMATYGINSLERRAMFLAQIGHESADLTTWDEVGSDTYFVAKYWVDKTKWSGLGGSTPTTTGLTLSVPAPAVKAPPPTAVYQLYWAKGPALSNGSSLIAGVTFKLSGAAYTYNFAGGVPPALTSYLLVVNPTTRQVVLAINQRLGNWSPQDAIDFHGRGPIQLTGRYNFQLFANNVGQQGIMTNPGLVSDPARPLLGLESAGWFWEVELGHKLNEVVDGDAGDASATLNLDVTSVINPGQAGLQDRLNRYLRIRGQLLDPAL